MPKPIAAIDLFCGVGGLSLGLKNAGIKIVGGFDVDPACEFPYSHNLESKFFNTDIRDLQPAELEKLWPKNSLRLLAGCAPCQPFSSHRRGKDTSGDTNWHLLGHFARLVEGTLPEFVTMENVARLKSSAVFEDFCSSLEELGYAVDYASLYGPDFGLPQERRRLVLVASKLGSVSVPSASGDAKAPGLTVRQAISGLPVLRNGERDLNDPLHAARRLSPLNLSRMKASKPGGTWADWPEELVSPCHRKESGATFKAFYGRMEWDSPSPTITTQSYNFGTGRFGHPEQNRSLTLREAAILQGFPEGYEFVKPDQKPSMHHVGRLIGNAVPPPFGEAVGRTFKEHAKLEGCSN